MKFISHYSSSHGNLYEVHGRHSKLIIEAGVRPALMRKALSEPLHDFSGAIISHRHSDHFKGIKELLKSGVYCYMSEETAHSIENSVFIKTVKEREWFYVGEFFILPLRTVHDCPGSLSFLIKNEDDLLFFATDTFYVPHKIDGITIAAIECNWSEETKNPNTNEFREKRLYKSHMNLSTVKEFFRAQDISKLREIHLLHLSDDNSDYLFFKKEIQRLTGKVVYVAQREPVKNEGGTNE